jgi:hypothetical protein
VWNNKMALADAVQDARHTGQTVTWTRDGAPVNLTGATMTGHKRDMETGAVTALDGTLTVVDEPNGVFTWKYGTEDVATPGTFMVQFTATYATDDVDRTLEEKWIVHDALSDEV